MKVISPIIIFLCLSAAIFAQKISTLSDGKNAVLENVVIIKFNDYSKTTGQSIQYLLGDAAGVLQITEWTQKFPNCYIPKENKNKFGIPYTDLRAIYEIKYAANIDVFKACNLLKKNPLVEYAEPHYIPWLLYVPDDPLNSNKYELTTIMAYEGWDIHQGDTNIVIGITDTGVDIDHEDLIDNIAYNWGDPFPYNGIDDDNDGFVDNFRGWDMAENDNNPQWEALEHGVYVSALSSASTDNGVGISGTGFKCRFLPVKISNSAGILTHAYEGIIYAADHGCQIINCSWGSTFYSRFSQDVIDYATINRNCLVIGAAGNSNNDDRFYPASYEYVLNTAATDRFDQKWSQAAVTGSNFGYTIDISAPGYQNYSAVNGGYLTGGGGTSFAAPITAGCAGIVLSYYQGMSPLQAAEQLRVTGDLIDTIEFNLDFVGQLGNGRLNLYNALSQTNMKSVRFLNKNITTQDGIITSGDTVSISGNFVNYLNDLENLQINLNPESPYVEIIEGYLNAGDLLHEESFSNNNYPFLVRIDEAMPYNSTVVIEVVYSGTDYYDYEYILFDVNNTIIDLDTNNIATSVTTNGRIGFSDIYQLNGLGFEFNNLAQLMYEGGLILGNSFSNISQCFRYEDDFFPDNIPYLLAESDYADVEVMGSYAEYSLNLDITQRTFAWTADELSDFIIIEYNLINRNLSSVDDLHAGVCIDWDITNAAENRVNFDDNLNLSYSYHIPNGAHAGIILLDTLPFHHYAIDNSDAIAGGFNINYAFEDDKVFIALTNNRNQAGVDGNGSDIAVVYSAGPLSIPAMDTLTLHFALLGGANLFDLQNNALSCLELFHNLNLSTNKPIQSNILNIYPNPASRSIHYSLQHEKTGKARIELYNSQGHCVYSEEKWSGNDFKGTIATDNVAAGVYLLMITTDEENYSRKVVISN